MPENRDIKQPTYFSHHMQTSINSSSFKFQSQSNFYSNKSDKKETHQLFFKDRFLSSDTHHPISFVFGSLMQSSELSLHGLYLFTNGHILCL